MRTRTRQPSAVSTKSSETYQFGTSISGPYGPRTCLPLRDVGTYQWYTFVEPARYEQIIDAGKVSRGTGTKIREVNHIKWEWTPLVPLTTVESPMLVRESYFGDYVYRGMIRKEDTSVLHALQTDSSPAAKYNFAFGQDISSYGPSVSRASELASKAIAKMDQIHLGNIAYEARELPGLARYVAQRLGLGSLRNKLLPGSGADVFSDVQRYLDAIRSGRWRRMSKAARDALRKLAQDSLATQFGLLPTVRDAQNITNGLLSKSKPRRKQFVVALSSPWSDSVQCKFKGNGRSSYLEGEMLEVLLAKRVDGLIVTDNRPGYETQFLKEAAASIDKWVGMNPSGLLWESTKWSWIVDWFLHIDQLLDHVFLNTNSVYTLEYWQSTKVAYHRYVSGSYSQEITGSSNPVIRWATTPTIKHTVSSYSRGPQEPPSMLSPIRPTMASAPKLLTLALVSLGLAPPGARSGAR